MTFSSADRYGMRWKLLEHQADGLTAVADQIRARNALEVEAVDDDTPLVRPVEPAQQVQEGRLPDPDGP